MPKVELDGDAITDWDAFHTVCTGAFGFPEFYGRNMNAWIDCLTYIGEGDGMSRFVLGPAEQLLIEVRESAALKLRAPDIVDALMTCTAAVNQRFVKNVEPPALLLRFT